jgi:predicted RNA-binding protein YlqC (UPF0109 family)
MSERPPEFVDLEDDDMPAGEDAADDADEQAGNGAGDDEVIRRAAAVLKYIVEHIVEEPEEIRIAASSDERGPLLLLAVSDRDRGKVIGRQGRIVQAIRTIVKAATVGTGERVNVEVLD